MPYVVSPQAVCSVTIVGRHEGQQVMNVFHYRYNGSQQLIDGAAALNALHVQQAGANGILQPWRLCVSEKVSDVKVRYQWGDPDRFAFIEKDMPIGNTGAVAGDAMPVNTAASITKRTEAAGRSQVGTLHMPGLPVTWITNGALTQAAIDAYTVLRAKMILAISTVDPPAEFLPVLFKRSSPTVSPQFTTTSLQGFARIMRRRTVGVGA